MGWLGCLHPGDVKVLIIYWLLASAAFSAEWDQLAGYRDWRSTDGKTFKAKLVGVTETGCRLKGHRDGRTREVSFDRLDKAEVKMIQEAKKEIREGKPLVKESFWKMAFVFREYDKLVSELPEDGIIVSLVPRRFVRESPKSIVVIGDHVAVRIISEKDDTILQISGISKVQAMKRTKVTTRRASYSYYGYQWNYDTRTKVYRADLCNNGTIFVPAHGDANPYKLLSVGVEKVGVGDYLLFSIALK